MSNEFEKIVGDIGHVIAFPFVRTEQFIKVLGTALTDAPEVKSSITELVKLGEAVVPDAAADIASKGIDLTSDVATITAVQAFFAYFSSTFLPAVESAYRSIQADVTDASSPSTTISASTASATP